MNEIVSLIIKLFFLVLMIGFFVWLFRRMDKKERKEEKEKFHKKNFKVKIPKEDNEYD